MIKVTVWNEYFHEREYEAIGKIYPDGIHGCIAGFLKANEDMSVRCATLDMPECGLPESVLDDTDVLIWWGHAKHDEIPDETAQRIRNCVLRGMGFIGLHSAHFSKPMKLLMGTTMSLKWHHGDSEKLICTAPSHPIAEGVPQEIVLPKEEMYGEYFDIPKPDDVVYTGWFASGNVFRSGCTFTRGSGKIFYFQPGHEEYPVYYDKNIQRIITNAVRFVKPVNRRTEDYEPQEELW